MVVTPYGYCHCGCGERTNICPHTHKKTGHIKGEPYKYIVGHHGNTYNEQKYVIDNTTGCWIWQGAKNSNGYGTLTVNRKSLKAHRYYYEQEFGSIPEDKELDHKCHNTSCVNPRHLRLATDSQNQGNQLPQQREKSSRYKGVFWDKQRNKWRVNITSDGKKYYVGHYIDEIDAAQAYNKKAIELFREFAYLNESF